ncbi:hypothetical protein D3C85_1080380 [compost metagenome]
MGHLRRHPDGPLRRHHPVALAGEHGDHPTGRIGELPALMGMQGEVMTIGIVNGGHHRVAGNVFRRVNFNHGPNLTTYDPIAQAGQQPHCA